MKRLYFFILCILILVECRNDACDLAYCIDHGSDRFLACSELQNACQPIGDYCLFGFKWGTENEFSANGEETQGPQTPGGTVSYSFQKSALFVDNHRQENVPTLSFDLMPSCTEELVERAFEEWAQHANIQFEKMPDDNVSDIRIYVADSFRAGLGYPNFDNDDCNSIGGQILFNPNDLHFNHECGNFYLLALHEIGHVLGLGHSSSNNVMGFTTESFEGLQAGDIRGIQQIYGED